MYRVVNSNPAQPEPCSVPTVLGVYVARVCPVFPAPRLPAPTPVFSINSSRAVSGEACVPASRHPPGRYSTGYKHQLSRLSFTFTAEPA